MTSEKESRKRSRSKIEEQDEEIEIDVNAAEPLSKRAARRAKKGRTLKQAPSSRKELDHINEESSDGESDDDDDSNGDNEQGKESHIEASALKAAKKGKRSTASKKASEASDEPKKGTNGIWIGNLSFRTMETDLTTFFSTLKPLGKTKKTSEYAAITASDVVRISLPMSEKKGQNKGFAYVDFSTPEQQETALALSERILQSRNVLIKPADSFEGRPAVKSDQKEEEEKATKILYVGNLPFDIVSSDLESYLGGKEAGIRKVRMATFEDSGKCKGFAFIDFATIENVKAILNNKKLQSINGRKLKMEYGEDRSLRRKPFVPSDGTRPQSGRMVDSSERKVDSRTITPGSALINAQRASVGIVPSAGNKISFD